jgi:hypothetical protein
MRNHHGSHHSSRAAVRLVHEPDRPVREAGSLFVHHVLSLLGVFVPLLAFALACVLLVFAWRVWGRHRLVAAGGSFELRLGEQVSRPALEAFTCTLAGGLPRPLFGAAPWVALSLSSLEDRASCSLFVSGGLSAAQVRMSIEQAFGGATVEDTLAAGTLGIDGGGCLRAAGLAAVGSRYLPLRADHRVDPAGQLLAALRAQEPGEGGVIQLVLQAPPRSAARRARSQAAQLRSGRGLQLSGALRALNGLASFVSEVADEFMPSGRKQRVRQQAPQRPVDPYSLERAKAIEVKSGQLLLAGTVRVAARASTRRRAGARLGGLLAAFGQFHNLGGLRRRCEPFCTRRLVACLPPVKPRLLLTSGEAAALVAVPEQSSLAPLSFAEAPSRTAAPAAQALSRGLLLGRSDHSGFDRDVLVEPVALLAHAHILGRVLFLLAAILPSWVLDGYHAIRGYRFGYQTSMILPSKAILRPTNRANLRD